MKYKVGDRVIVGEKYQKGIEQNEPDQYVGTVAVVIQDTNGTVRWPYMAQFFDGTKAVIGDHEIERLATEKPESNKEAEFKVGDKVRVSHEWSNSGAGEENERECHGKVGTVVGRTPWGAYDVKFPNGKLWAFDDQSEFLELVSGQGNPTDSPEFKVGDKVRATDQFLSYSHRGMVCEIVQVDNDEIPYKVQFEDGSYFWSKAERIVAAESEIAKPKFKVGDRVRLTKDFELDSECGGESEDYFGTEAEIVEVRSSSCILPYLVRLHDDQECPVDCKEIKLIESVKPLPSPEFKVGDYVRMTGEINEGSERDREIYRDIYKGKCAKILEIDDSDKPYRVLMRGNGPNASSWIKAGLFEHFKPIYPAGMFVRYKEVATPDMTGEIVEFKVIDWEPKYLVRFASFDSWISGHCLEPAEKPQEAATERSCPKDACCSSSCPSRPQGASSAIASVNAMKLSEAFLAGASMESEVGLGMAAAKPEVSVADAGAVRSKDADDFRYDLITPIGLEVVSCYASEYYRGLSESGVNDEGGFAESAVSGALHSIREFLSDGSDRTREDHLADAFMEVGWAVDFIESGDSDRFDEYLDRFKDLTPGYYYYQAIPPSAIRAVARAAKEGSAKYGDHNWLKGFPVSDLLNHGEKHLWDWIEGDRSEDHLGHALWNILAAIHSYKQWPHLNRGTLCGPKFTPPADKEVAR